MGAISFNPAPRVGSGAFGAAQGQVMSDLCSEYSPELSPYGPAHTDRDKNPTGEAVQDQQGYKGLKDWHLFQVTIAMVMVEAWFKALLT